VLGVFACGACMTPGEAALKIARIMGRRLRFNSPAKLFLKKIDQGLGFSVCV
jgi:hypothetical protein